jgi:hypothetical protein
MKALIVILFVSYTHPITEVIPVANMDACERAAATLKKEADQNKVGGRPSVLVSCLEQSND